MRCRSLVWPPIYAALTPRSFDSHGKRLGWRITAGPTGPFHFARCFAYDDVGNGIYLSQFAMTSRKKIVYPMEG